MQIKIYVDVLFLVNLMSDYLLLATTAMLLKLSPRTHRLLLSALLGAVYALVVFFIPLALLSSLVSKLVWSAVLVMIAFGAPNFRIFIKRLSAFYLTTLTLGGLCFALFAATDLGSRFGAVYASGVLYLDLPAYQLTLSALVLYFVLRTALRTIEKATKKSCHIQKVRLFRGEQSIILPALYDTGNFLTDPTNGKGVILAEESAIAPLLRQITEELTPISCRGIGGQEALYGFYAGAETVNTAFHTYESSQRLIAITTQRLDSCGQYSLILPNDFKGENRYDGTPVKGRFYFGKSAVAAVQRLAHRAGDRRGILHQQRRGTSRASVARGRGNTTCRSHTRQL